MNNFYKGGRELAYLKGLSHHAVQQKTTATRQHFQTALQVNSLACQFLFIKPITLLRKLWKSKAILLLGIALLNMFSLSAQTPRKDSGAEGLTNIKPLKIGDTIPESLWNMPLEVVNHPSEKKTITLNDYRDKKLIILDFWATWCAGCIAAFPHLHEIEKQSNHMVKVLSVTYQNQIVVDNFRNKSDFLNKANLLGQFSSIINDNVLRQYFKSAGIPHLAVLDQSGKVRALTLPEEITKENIDIWIDQPYSVPVIKRLDKVEKPLISSPYVKDQYQLYHSSLMPFNPALPYINAQIVDTIAAVKHFYNVNAPIIALLSSALSNDKDFEVGLANMPSRRILEVSDPTKFDDWTGSRVNYFTYESINPINQPDSLIRKRMYLDLSYYLGLSARFQKKEIPCLILRVADKSKIPYSIDSTARPSLIINGVVNGDGTIEGRFAQKLSSGQKVENVNLAKNFTVKTFVDNINKWRRDGLLYLIDETGITKKLDLKLSDDLTDISALSTILKKQGILLSTEKRSMNMFIITESGYIPSTDKLILSKVGLHYANKLREEK